MSTPDSVFCPICSRDKVRPLLILHKPEVVFFRCKICQHRFADTHHVSKSDLESIYDDSYSGFREDPLFQQAVSVQLRTVFATRRPKGRILDVGCGNGAFLEEAKTHGYEVVGIDISQVAVQLTQQRQISAVVGDFMGTEFPDSFDFITMWDVIEHLQEPRSFVERAFELLPAGGFLVIRTPFVGEPAFHAALGSRRLAGVFLQFPCHIQFFSKVSLSYLLNSVGLQSIEWLPGQHMRSNRRLNSVRAVAGRVLRIAVGSASGNHDLYVMAKK